MSSVYFRSSIIYVGILFLILFISNSIYILCVYSDSLPIYSIYRSFLIIDSYRLSEVVFIVRYFWENQIQECQINKSTIWIILQQNIFVYQTEYLLVPNMK